MYLHGTSTINARGHLEIGGCDTVELAERFGTPLYVVDEALVRSKCRAFMNSFRESGLSYQVAYASKAFCTLAMCRLIDDEGLYLDVVSDGELQTALRAGFPAQRIHFHGNNKTPEEMEMGIDAGISSFVVHNYTELHLLNAIAAEKKKTVDIVFRISPGVEAHTHDYISTGQEDSKFGFDLASGAALRAVKEAAELTQLKVLGIHSHIGSQIFEPGGFKMAADKLIEFALKAREETGIVFKVVNLGGGFGIRYVEGDTPLQISEYVEAITQGIADTFGAAGYPQPEICIEPGRSIIGDAGTTLYTIGSTKDIPGIRKYVSINGGMTDNIRPALYQAKYEAMLANRGTDANEESVSIAGRCCESGDMLIWDIELPKVHTGDLLAVSTTGAYNYSMANNYNRVRRPAVVFVKDGQADLVARRESYDYINGNDVIPARLRKQEAGSGV